MCAWTLPTRPLPRDGGARERERTSRPMAPKADKERAAAAAKKIEDKTFGMKNKNKVPREC